LEIMLLKQNIPQNATQYCRERRIHVPLIF
jgi:hypothetical protein